jgi:hypothetical protein
VSWRSLANFLYFGGLALCPLGVGLHNEIGLALSAVMVGLGYAMRDYFVRRPDSVTVMSIYGAFAALWFGVGNLVGYLLKDTSSGEIFYSYEAGDYIFEAQVLATLGACVPLLAYEMGRKRPLLRRLGRSLPRIGFDMPDRVFLQFGLLVLGICWAARFLEFAFKGIGTAAVFAQIGSQIFVFSVVYRMTGPRATLPRWARKLATLVVITDLLYYLMFGRMRVLLVWTASSLLLPYILRKQITPRRFALGLLFVLGFAMVFKPLGVLRTQLFGTERLEQIIEMSALIAPDEEQLEEEDKIEAGGPMYVLARLSTFNQLSQVVRIAFEEGHYGGQTLEYLLYVFVPRMVWPDKPTITSAQWFAEKLGRGYHLAENRWSNAINMTIPGELYLNYGWLGVGFGLALLGWLYFVFWEATRFYQQESNPVGQGFSFALLAQAMFNGSHVGGMVSLAVYYLLFLFLSWIFSLVLVRRAASRRMMAAPRIPPVGWQPKPSNR